MLCACHGEPCYWQKDKRNSKGGWWECPVRRRAHNAARYTNDERRERINAQKRDRYDADPIHRISKRLHDDARKRRETIERRKAALTEEG